MTHIRTKIVGFIIVIHLLSCNNQGEMLNIQTNGYLTIIDSTQFTQNLLHHSNTDNYGIYPIYYNGVISDTIKLRKNQIPRYGQGTTSINYKRGFEPVDSSTLSIYVDTLLNLSHKLNLRSIKNEPSMNSIDSIVNYKSYAIITKNLSDSLLYLSDCYILSYLTRQAKNENGEWVDIEKNDEIFCGFGCLSVIIEPKHMIVSKMMRYKGQFKTECRLKYSKWGHNVYSNSFFDNIDKAQLKSVMD